MSKFASPQRCHVSLVATHLSSKMKVAPLALLLVCASVKAEQGWFSKGIAGVQRYLNPEAEEQICEPVLVTFDEAADGTPLAPPLCVDNQWAEFGLSFFAEGGKGKRPCLFDTANPGSEAEGGDEDLGAPNEACSPAGPGVGEGGAPGKEGENCEPLGNVLIVQEKNVDVPDDNKEGGILTIDFPTEGGQYVYNIGLLDIDYETSVVIVHETEEGEITEYSINVPTLGDNSYQTVEINQERVRWIKVMFSRSGAVTFVQFCPLLVTPPAPTPIDLGPPSNGEPTPEGGTETGTPTATPTVGGGGGEPTPEGGGGEPTPEGGGGEPTPEGGGGEPTPEGGGGEPTPEGGGGEPTPEGGGGEPTPEGGGGEPTPEGGGGEPTPEGGGGEPTPEGGGGNQPRRWTEPWWWRTNARRWWR